MDEFTIIFIAVVVMLWLLFQLFPGRRSNSGSEERRSHYGSLGPGRGERSHYSAVTINPAPNGCNPVQALAGTRYLLPDAPLLPLSNCDRSKCNCRYRHHYDRRRGSNNRRRFRMVVGNEIDHDRRYSRGRRAADFQLA